MDTKSQIDFWIDQQIEILENELEKIIDDYIEIVADHHMNLALGGDGQMWRIREYFNAIPEERAQINAKLKRLRSIDRAAIATDIDEALSGLLGSEG